jgi:hypothetical protein
MVIIKHFCFSCNIGNGFGFILKGKKAAGNFLFLRLVGCWWLRLASIRDDAHFQNNVAVKRSLPAEKTNK